MSIGETRLNDVKAFASNDVWAVGEFREVTEALTPQPLLVHWNGTAWQQVLGESFAGELQSIYGTSPSDVWAVGSGKPIPEDPATTLIEHWDGASWTEVVSPPALPGDNFLRAVYAITPDDVYALGYGFNGISSRPLALIFNWDGNSWTRELPVVPTRSSLYGLVGDTSGILFAVGPTLDILGALTVKCPDAAPVGGFVLLTAEPRSGREASSYVLATIALGLAASSVTFLRTRRFRHR